MIYAVLPNVSDDENIDLTVYLQRAKESRQATRLRIKYQETSDSRRCNLRRSNVECQPGDRVWVWVPIRQRGLKEKLL